MNASLMRHYATLVAHMRVLQIRRERSGSKDVSAELIQAERDVDALTVLHRLAPLTTAEENALEAYGDGSPLV
jgi:hypothetical protein